MSKKIILIVAVGAAIMAGCSGHKTQDAAATADPTAEGTWTMPNPDDSAGVMGVRLQAGGKAESINMPTLPYSAWQQSGDTVVLTGQSIMDGETEPVSDTCIVSGDKMSILGTDIVYKRK